MNKVTNLLKPSFVIFCLSIILLTIVTITKLPLVSVVDATCCHTQWGPWVDTSACITSDCGTTDGTKTQSRTCIAGGSGYDCELAHEECTWDCRVVVGWMAYRCNSSYTYWTSDGKCHRSGHPSQNPISTFGPLSFSYNKSHDKNKCHRDTASSLGVPAWAQNEFNSDHPEHINGTNLNCFQVPADTQTRTTNCCDAPYVACETSVDCAWHWSECSASCGGGIQTVIVDTQPENGGEACPTESQSCNTQSCESGVTPTVTPIPTPTDTPHVGGDNGGGNGNPGAPVCNDSDPGVPGNLRATALGGGKVRLDWDSAPGSVTTYAVAYGPSVGNYLYGDPNVGKVNTYTVQALTPGANYCFYVQAQNGCRGGSPSNVVCSNQGSGSLRILGASTKYNPLVDGIKETYGGDVLGISTEMPQTSETEYGTSSLPTGNIESVENISIPSMGINTPVFASQLIGGMPAVGFREVLKTVIGQSTIYYAHNATDLFGRLYQIDNGAVINLNDGTERQFKVIGKDYISSQNTAYFDRPEPGVIYLMTCSYTYPDQRIVIKAINL